MVFVQLVYKRSEKTCWETVEIVKHSVKLHVAFNFDGRHACFYVMRRQFSCGRKKNTRYVRYPLLETITDPFIRGQLTQAASSLLVTCDDVICIPAILPNESKIVHFVHACMHMCVYMYVHIYVCRYICM